MFSVIVCRRVACLYALGRERAEQGGPGRAGRPRDGSIATTKTRSWPGSLSCSKKTWRAVRDDGPRCHGDGEGDRPDQVGHRRDLPPREDRQAIPALGLPLPDPPLRDAEWIAAYRRWAG